MQGTTIVGVLIAVILVGYLVFFARPPASGDKRVLFNYSLPGDVVRTFPPTSTPLSFNQPEGLTYSYTAWILIRDFTFGYGQRRVIFSKGDSPGLSIDSTSNSFIVTIDTFGAKETILIPNIPAMKWIHFALVVDQNSVDVYINGILRKHHTLGQLPKQNDTALSVGSTWNGVIARLTYFARSLNYLEIKEMLKEEVPDDLDRTPAGPNYFDITWYIGRLYSE